MISMNASTSSTEDENHAFSSQFAALLKPIRELTKQGACWDVNIAAKLEEYVHYIAHLPIEVNVGGEQMKLDFAKAAMVVQNSVQIYSKKVENLWILLQEVIEFLSSHGANPDNPEDGQNPTGVNRLKRIRRRHQKGDVDLLQPVLLKFRKFNSKIKKKNVPAKELKKMQTVPYEILQLEEAVNSANPLKIKLYTLSNEHLGYPSDLRSNFLFDPITFFLKIDNCPIMNLEAQNRHLLDERLPPILVAPLPPTSPHTSFDGLNDEPPNLEWQNDNDASSEPETSPVEHPVNQEMPVERNMQLRQRENLERIPIHLQEKSDPWRGIDPYTDEESIKKPCGPPVKIKLPQPLRKEVSRKRKEVGKDPINDTHVNVRIDEYLGQVQRGAQNNRKPNAKNSQPDSEFWEDFVHFSKTTGSRIRKQLKQKHNVNQVEIMDDDDSIDHRDDANNNGDPPDFDDHPRFGGMNDDDDFHFDPITGEPHLSTTSDLDDTKQFFQLVQQFMTEYTASAQNFVQQTESTKRVQAWHAMIQPRLQEAESRRDFDIHLYGSRILDTFGNEAPLGSLTNFAQIVQKEPKNEVARYFLAALQLANTYNVEIGPQGGLEMDGVQLRLLSMERHHEHMDDFV